MAGGDLQNPCANWQVGWKLWGDQQRLPVDDLLRNNSTFVTDFECVNRGGAAGIESLKRVLPLWLVIYPSL